MALVCGDIGAAQQIFGLAQHRQTGRVTCAAPCWMRNAVAAVIAQPSELCW